MLVDFPTAQPEQTLVGGVGSGEYLRPGALLMVSSIALGCRCAIRWCAILCDTGVGLDV